MRAQELINTYVMHWAGGAGAAPNIPLLHHVLPDDVHAPEDDDLSADYPGAYPRARMRAGAALPEAGSRVGIIRQPWLLRRCWGNAHRWHIWMSATMGLGQKAQGA